MTDIERRALPAPLEERRQFGIRELLSIAIRRRKVVMIVALPLVIGAAIGTFRSSNTVTARARIMIQAQEPESPEFSTNAPNWEMIMSSASQVAMSIPVADAAATALWDTVAALGRSEVGFPRFANRGQLKRTLIGGLDCGPVGESNILSFSFTHTSPHFCLLAVDALLHAFIDFSTAQLQNVKAIKYYDEQIAGMDTEVDSLLALRAAVAQRAGVTTVQTDASFGVSQVRQLETVLFSARSRRESIEARLAGFKKALAENPEHVPTSPNDESTFLVDLKRGLETEVAQLGKLRSKYSDDSEFVSRQQRVVDAAREELRKELQNYVQNLQVALAEAWRVENMYVETVRKQTQMCDAYPEAARQLDALELQLESRKELLKALQFKRGEVRLKSGSDARISGLVPLDEPALRVLVTTGKKALFLALAGILGLAVGLVSALFVDNQDHRIFERRQSEQYLELPVLAAISLDEPGGHGKRGKP
jgi:uncharacterized protein involved in exopolysaccharide biosynthesis